MGKYVSTLILYVAPGERVFRRVSGMSRLFVTSVNVGSGCGHTSLYLIINEWMLKSGGGGIFQERRIPFEPTRSPSGLNGATGTIQTHTHTLHKLPDV